MSNAFRTNNFDLIRIIAAMQVALDHSMAHLEIKHESSVLLSILSYFPGVPVFFFVSGFLISKSYETNSRLKDYLQNRALRIFPALIVCTALALLSVYLSGYLANKNYHMTELVFWLFGQVTFIQFYNPDFMREFGTGVMNGSLWTISVELQFYIMVPVLYWVFGLWKLEKINYKLLLLVLVFMMVCFFRNYLNYENNENILFKLFSVSFIPWIWMFLVGVIFQKNFKVIHRVLAGKVLYILMAYLIIVFLTTAYLGWDLGNEINPILFLCLSIVVFSSAYSFPRFSQNLLKKNDISYGIYIYHIPVVNVLIYYGYTSRALYLGTALGVTIMLAILSWFIIEKNSMKLKAGPLK